jgi:hypothetical protein
MAASPLSGQSQFQGNSLPLPALIQDKLGPAELALIGCLRDAARAASIGTDVDSTDCEPVVDRPPASSLTRHLRNPLAAVRP